jgi:hypothetical protein
MVPRGFRIRSYRQASYDHHSGPKLLVDLCRRAVLRFEENEHVRNSA